MAMDKAVMVIAVTVMLVIISREGGVQAKRGCANFGHSCYGGMGKRSELEDTNGEVVQNTISQDTEDPAFVITGPRSIPTSLRFPTLFSRYTPEQYEEMNKFVREWIINYLRKDEEMKKK